MGKVETLTAYKYNLERFITEHERTFDTAYKELAAGHKRSHWSWFIIPQIAGLGRTYMSQKYAIKSLDEAKAFLEHPYLGGNIRKIAEVLLTLESNDATDIMGFPDDMKLRSSMTLFLEAAPDEVVFQKVLDKFFNGEKDQKTLDLLGI